MFRGLNIRTTSTTVQPEFESVDADRRIARRDRRGESRSSRARRRDARARRESRSNHGSTRERVPSRHRRRRRDVRRSRVPRRGAGRVRVRAHAQGDEESRRRREDGTDVRESGDRSVDRDQSHRTVRSTGDAGGLRVDVLEQHGAVRAHRTLRGFGEAVETGRAAGRHGGGANEGCGAENDGGRGGT